MWSGGPQRTRGKVSIPYARTSDGTHLYFEDQGQGDCLLLLAGRNANHHSWLDLPTTFAERYRVIAFDYRGTGLSDAPEDPDGYSTRNFARDAWAILDHLNIERMRTAPRWGDQSFNGSPWSLSCALEHW